MLKPPALRVNAECVLSCSVWMTPQIMCVVEESTLSDQTNHFHLQDQKQAEEISQMHIKGETRATPPSNTLTTLHYILAISQNIV